MKNDNIVTNVDTTFLKLIAVICMVIDHVGSVLFNNNLIMRGIGRISFPLFAYSVMIGYFKTKDINKYIIRMFVVGVVSQPLYMMVFNTYNLNIMFTLVALVLMYYFLDNKKYLFAVLNVVVGIIMRLDYFAIYPVLALIFYYGRNNKMVLGVPYTLFYLNYFLDKSVSIENIPYSIVGYSLLALPFILINTKTKCKINKYFFYVFYPLHLLIILLVKYSIM